MREALCSAVRAELTLGMAGKDGVTLRAKLEQIEKTTGKRSRKLDGVRVPPVAAHVWQWYWELRRDVAVSMAEIETYARLLRLQMTPWEIQTIRAMDATMAEVLADRARGALSQEEPDV